MLFVAMCLPNGNLLGQLHLHDDLLGVRVLVVLLRVKNVISFVLESQRETQR